MRGIAVTASRRTLDPVLLYSSRMRVALLYPPPWKIPLSQHPGEWGEEGPPPGFHPGDLDADFHQIPYGLLSLAAQAIAAGHQVRVLNLSSFPWQQVERVLAALSADVYGMSCWTANRRGVGFVAEAIRALHPAAHVTVGGPHATPLAREMLHHHPAIDTVAVGESELTFLELLERLEAGRDVEGLAGAWYRSGGRIVEGPVRASVKDLDELASVHEHFDTHIVMTSRGCPWQCTFCGAETTWGRGFRGRSVTRVLDDLEAALARVPVAMLQIKDDTFTANRKRALQICRGIVERRLNFLWSCDTRVDVLTEELLLSMRQAGCVRLSLGVESGSPKVLAAIDKKISVEQILRSTELAKSYGIAVRFYMMLGNRGETLDTFRETLDFLRRARPHQYLFSCLSIYPGTVDFHTAQREGWLSPSVYFEESFQELKMPFDADEACTREMAEWFARNKGLHTGYVESVEEAQAIARRVGGGAGVTLDVAGAHYRAGNLEAAQQAAEQALAAGHPCPGLCHNYLACIAAQRGKWQAMQDHFSAAARVDPQHYVLMSNVQRARSWFARGGPEAGEPLRLEARHDFQLFERTLQPVLPGPLPEDFASFPPALERAPRSPPGPRSLPVLS